jgi:hypothetical protein
MKNFHFPNPDKTNWKLICDSVSVGGSCSVTYDNLPGEDTFLRDEERHFMVTSPGYPKASVCVNNNFQLESVSSGYF